MNVTRIYAMALRYLYLLQRSPMRIIELIYWPFMNLAVWGFITVYLRSNTFGITQAAGLFLGAPLIAFYLILSMFGWAFGMFIMAILIRWGLAAEAFAWAAMFAIMPIAGVYYPIAALPGWLQPVAWALPSAYVFEGSAPSCSKASCAPITSGRGWLSTAFTWLSELQSSNGPFTLPGSGDCCLMRINRPFQGV